MHNATCCCKPGACRRCAKLFSILRVESALHPTSYLLIVALFIAGCGHKGPLYLPDQKPASAKRGSKPAPAPDTPAPAAETPARP